MARGGYRLDGDDERSPLVVVVYLCDRRCGWKMAGDGRNVEREWRLEMEGEESKAENKNGARVL